MIMNYLRYLDLTRENFGIPKKGWWAIPTVRQFADAKGITPREYIQNLYRKEGKVLTKEQLESVDIDKPFIYALVK